MKKSMFIIPTKQTEEAERKAAPTAPAAKPVPEKKAATLKDAFNFKNIQRYKIQFNKDNEFPMKDIEELADSILHNGLQHNITLIYSEDEDTFTLESGERRIRSLDILEDKYKSEEFTPEEKELYESNIKPLFDFGIPSKVKYVHDNFTDLDALESKIRMEIANTDVRTYTPSETAANIARLKKLYEEKAKLTGEKININETVANASNLSKMQTIRYSHAANLIPELKEILDAGNLTIKEGAGYGKLSEEEQKAIAKLIQNGQTVGKQEVAAIREQMERLNAEKAEKEAALITAKAEAAAIKEAGQKKLSALEIQIDSLKEQLNDDKSEENRLLKDQLEALEQRYRKEAEAKAAKEKELLTIQQNYQKEIRSLKSAQKTPVDKKAIALISAESNLKAAINELQAAQQRVTSAKQKVSTVLFDYERIYKSNRMEYGDLVQNPEEYKKAIE